jgi:hypothetical protein
MYAMTSKFVILIDVEIPFLVETLKCSKTLIPQLDFIYSDISKYDIKLSEMLSKDEKVHLPDLTSKLVNISAQKLKILKLGNLWLNISENAIYTDLAFAKLTQMQTRIMAELLANTPNAISKQGLLVDVLRYSNDSDTNALQTQISKLRTKLRDINSSAEIIFENDHYKII